MVTLLIMANGRKEYLEKELLSLSKLHGTFSHVVVHDDSSDPDFYVWLQSLGYDVVQSNKTGFTSAMITAWNKVRKDKNEWVFHLEEDFTFLKDVYVDDMITVMENNKHLAQIVLQRQGIGGREIRKGGIMLSHPERYTEKTDGKNFWSEHRVNFSCNPSLYRKSLIIDHPWPYVKDSERYFSKMLLKDLNLRFAYWGKVNDPPMVFHIGEIRNGFGY